MDRSSKDTEQEIVPKPVIGHQSGAQAEKVAETLEKAQSLFVKAKKKLFDINHWHEYAGKGSATFALTDKSGNIVYRLPEKGDFIRIDLPGPGSKEGHGYDWVRIEAIDEKKEDVDEYAAIRVRPSPNPRTPGDDKVAHFHDNTATSTFIVQRAGKKVSTAEKGRNELQNKDEDLSLFDKIRNVITSFSASRGAAWPQWKALMEGFLEDG